MLSLLMLPVLAASSPSEEMVALGRSKLTELSLAVSRPRYGECWSSALSALQPVCQSLDQSSHSRLALQFANCQLAQSGQKTFPCGAEEDIASCLETVDTFGWTSYTSFYTHTHNMCHFIQSQLWQEETDLTITKLSKTSAKAVEALEESQQLQEEIAEGQRESLEYQRKLVENGSYLSQAIEASRGNVQEMMEEFKVSTLEQRNMIFEVFDRVSRLQNLVVSEVSWLYTVVFYCFSLLVIYLVTATKRTADARLWLFLLLSINFGLERLVSQLTLEYEGELANDISSLLSRRVWLLRNTTAFMAFVTLTLIAARFKDYNRINNCLLEEIKKQNLDMRSRMESFNLDQPDNRRNALLGVNIEALLADDTGFDGDEEDWDEDSDDSGDSTRTDVTYRPGSRDTSPTKSVCQTPVKYQHNTTYNFRSREKSKNFTDQNLEESPETFSDLVKSAQRKQKRISSKLHIAQNAWYR